MCIDSKTYTFEHIETHTCIYTHVVMYMLIPMRCLSCHTSNKGYTRKEKRRHLQKIAFHLSKAITTSKFSFMKRYYNWAYQMPNSLVQSSCLNLKASPKSTIFKVTLFA